MDRVTIQEAAHRLGVSEGAVRKRVARGTLKHDKEDGGRVYVYLDARGRRGVDGGVDDALVARLEDEVAYLREMLRREQEINAMHASNMRALSAPESPESERPGAQEEEPPAEAESPENRSSRQRSWWRFWR